MEGSGAYAMSKHAMVAYTNTLRLEMKKHGVGVSIVEPAGFLTGKNGCCLTCFFPHIDSSNNFTLDFTFFPCAHPCIYFRCNGFTRRNYEETHGILRVGLFGGLYYCL